MHTTIAISDLQKSPKKALQNTKGLSYIFANNKKKGGLIDESFLNFLEKEGVLESYEDYQLAHDSELIKRSQKSKKILQGQDFSDTLTLEEL